MVLVYHKPGYTMGPGVGSWCCRGVIKPGNRVRAADD